MASKVVNLTDEQIITVEDIVADIQDYSEESLSTVKGCHEYDAYLGKPENTTSVYKLFKKNIPSFLSGGNKNIPVASNEDDVLQILSIVINISYYDYNEIDAIDYLSKDKASVALGDIDFINDHKKLGAYISTHNVKLCDSTLPHRQILFSDEAFNNEGFICSQNTLTHKQYEFSGWAKLLKQSSFITTEFCYKSKIVSVFEELLQEKSLISILVNEIAGYDVAVLLKGVLYESVTSESKVSTPGLQVLIPTDSDYVAVTPAPSVAFSRVFYDEFYKTSTENYKSNQENKSLIFNIGGSNPQNCGQFNSSIIGTHRTLVANLPSFEEADEPNHLIALNLDKNSVYVAIEMKAYDVNVQGNNYAAGLPAVTALAGFSHMIERELTKALPGSLKSPLKAMQILHQVDDVPFTEAHVLAYSGERKYAGKKQPAIIDKHMAHIHQTVILKIDALDKQAVMAWAKGRLFKVLRRSRFSGGTLDLKPKGIKSYYSLEDALFEINSPGSSYVLVDAGDRLKGVSSKERLSCFFDSLIYDKDKKAVKDNIVPLARGFVPVKAPTDHNLGRMGYPHFYGEPVAGLGQLLKLSSFKVQLTNNNNEIKAFWAYPNKPASKLGLVVSSYAVS